MKILARAQSHAPSMSLLASNKVRAHLLISKDNMACTVVKDF
jgi:hypothetical protein